MSNRTTCKMMSDRENAEDTLPARVVRRALALAVFAAAAFAGLTATDAAAQNTIIYAAEPANAVSVRIAPLGPSAGEPELVFIGTEAGMITATIFGITGTVDTNNNNAFTPLPESATGTLLVTLTALAECDITAGCGGHFGLIGGDVDTRLANFITLDAGSISMYAEAFGRYVPGSDSGGTLYPQGYGLLEIVNGESLLYHLLTTVNPARNATVLQLFDVLASGTIDILHQEPNNDGLLHRAALNINTVALSVLLSDPMRLDPNRRAADGRTPLLYLVSAALSGSAENTTGTVALSIMLANADISSAINSVGNDGKSALDIAAERSETGDGKTPNLLAASVFAQLMAAGAECVAGTSSLCPTAGRVELPQGTIANLVFVIRGDNGNRGNPNLTAPGLIAPVIAVDNNETTIGVLSSPGNGKLRLKLKTAVIVLPPPINTPPIN